MGMRGMIAIWDSRFSVGNALADAEHRQVISILNEIHVACSVGAPPEVIGMALESLEWTIDAHFARDRYPCGEHSAIAAFTRRIRASWKAGDHDALSRRTLVNLARRWIDHMGRREHLPTTHRMAG
jgi:hypothetical protein